MMKTVRVVLDITYNHEQNDSPADWQWHGLLDLAADEQVMMVAATEMVIEDYEPTN